VQRSDDDVSGVSKREAERSDAAQLAGVATVIDGDTIKARSLAVASAPWPVKH